MAYIETPDGIPLYYEEHGEGETILLVHGWTCNTEYWWQKNIPALAESNHVVAFDLRGHGLSGKTDANHTFVQYAHDVRHLIESLDLTDVTLVGWSMGADVVFTYLDLFGSDRLRALGLIDQTPRFYSEEGWDYPLFGDFTPDGLAELVGGLETDRETIVKDVVVGAFFVERPPEETVDRIYAEMMKTPTSVAVTTIKELASADFRDSLARIDVPTLLMYGSHSGVFPGPLGEWMAEQIPESELVTFESSSHCPFWEEPERFNRELSTFVARHAGSDIGEPGTVGA
ncbi:alpha/beta fold hydrolase [Haloferax namakaokahaiae]|uniref:Alpha/beta fold hydrolase n=1 Tax=Haloferax namakaokahaiae TaxID=1748331 RepID=A0ABD5ZJY3_9EURY